MTTEHEAIQHLFARWAEGDPHTMSTMAIASALTQVRWASFLAGYRAAEQHAKQMREETEKIQEAMKKESK